MEIVKKILNSILISITILIIIFNLYVLYNREILKKNDIKIFGYSAFVIVSGSMEPTINVDDLIIIKEKNVYNENDIISYNSNNNSIITHRIIKIENNLLYTKGDNNNLEDEPIEFSQVVGALVYKINGFGKIVTLISSPIGITIFLAILYFIVKGTMLLKKQGG